MQDFSRMVHICHYVLETEHLDGDMVEFGCYIGDTAKMMMALSKRTMHVYDSFQGLPDDGRMSTNVERLQENFKGTICPVVHAGWFKDLTDKDLPEKISLAHLDGDMYPSIMESLNLVYGRMVKGGVILVDDFNHPQWPGVRQAVGDFFRDKPEAFVPLGNIAGSRGTKACVIKL